MDEKLKFRREMIFKVLAWGTVVYLLVMGYSINQSGLFELQPAEKHVLKVSDNEKYQVFKDLDGTKLEHAKRLELQAAKLEHSVPEKVAETIDSEKINKATKDNVSEAAALRVEAAQLRTDVYLAQEEREDGQERAKGLMIGAFIYSLIYPVVIWLVYKRAEPGVGTVEMDVIPLWLALTYAIFMSVATCWTAFATAIR